MSEKRRALLLGLGLDGKDGHVRITKGEDFALFGGSEKTHAKMQEKAVEFADELKKRGKSLSDASRAEIREIADKIGLNPPRRRARAR
ncbi:MAG: hypothetical protein L0216_19970 [Planctomycetales bacterium]|nr:hypothetical protein [Planctomycetales bacterium]